MGFRSAAEYVNSYKLSYRDTLETLMHRKLQPSTSFLAVRHRMKKSCQPSVATLAIYTVAAACSHSGKSLAAAVFDAPAGDRTERLSNHPARAESTTAATSTCGNHWKVAHDPVDPLHRFYDVVWSGKQFLAVGEGITVASPDAIQWKTGALFSDDAALFVTWAQGQFVAVGPKGMIQTSPDGVTWIERHHALPNADDTGYYDPQYNLHAVTWHDGLFVAVGNAGLPIITSTDGITWTERVAPTGDGDHGMGEYLGLQHVTWGNNQFLAVGDMGTILTSPDGIKWTKRTSGTSQTLTAAVWNGKTFVAVGLDGARLISKDGITWADHDPSEVDHHIHLLSVHWNGQQFLAVGMSGVILSSVDGITWKTSNVGVSAEDTLRAIAWDGSQYIAVSEHGTLWRSTCSAGTTYPVVVSKSGGNGTVTSVPAGIACGTACTANFKMNTSVKLVAKPDKGYSLAGWSGDCVGAKAACTFKADAEKHVTALFAKITSYALTLKKAGTGTGTVAGGGQYAAGATITLTATAKEGSTFAGWGPKPCASQFKMPASALKCTATFKLKP